MSLLDDIEPKLGRYLIVVVLLTLLFSSSIFLGSFSPIFLNASAQSNRGEDVNDRLNQRIDLSEKLRKVSGERIPNHYIVVLKDTAAPLTSSVRSSAEEARNQGAELRHVYNNAIRGYAIRVPNQEVLDSILSNPSVDYVQPDTKLKAFVQTLPTGIDRADGDLSSANSGDGSGSVNIDIAIMDTGIDLDHPDLNVFREKTFVSGTTTANDDDGHGTMVAGVAAAKDDSNAVVGMAPGARLWAIKVLDSNGDGFDSDIIAGVDYVTANAGEIDTVNLSFGGDGPDNALHTAIANSVAAGVTYVAAAGNEDQDAASQVPASYPEVITVSAIVDTDGKCGGLGFSTTAGNDDTLADFSNFGTVVDIAAPGVIVKTTAMGGSTASFSGTSASTPHVTGAAALYESTHPGTAPSAIRDALRNSGSTASTVCDGKGHGYFTGDKDSSPEPLLYMASGSPPTDTTPPTVTNTDPVDGATGVSVTKSVSATFSEAVQGSTVSTTTFTLKAGTTSIPGTVTLSGGNIATFDPTSSLAASTTYTATITGGSSGVKDLAGNQMSANKILSFTTAAAPPPPPPPSSCNNNLAINTATSTPTQSGFPANNAIDNTASTKWWSTFSASPSITVDLGTSKTVCSVVISWADGNLRTYSFRVEVSASGSFTPVLTTTSKGTTSPETYSFADSSARFVKIVITQSHAGSSNSLAQISEIDVLGKTTTSSVDRNSNLERGSSNQMPNTLPQESKLNGTKGSSTDIIDRGSSNEVKPSNDKILINHNPVAKDDRVRTVTNNPVLVKVLANDKDRDGDKLNVLPVSPSTYGATVLVNENGTILFKPVPDFVGVDTFFYSISDGKGGINKAKVSVNVITMNNLDSDSDNKQMAMTRDQSGDEENSNKKVIDERRGDKSHISIDKLIQKRWQENQTNSAN